MDCSICFDEINAAGGQVTLGCQHHFHLGCIGRWLLKNETCPMCRQLTSEKEKILNKDEELAWADEEEEEDEEEEMEETDIPEYNEAAHALWVMRKTFEMLEDGQSISTEGSGQAAESVETVRMRSVSSFWQMDDRGYESA